MRFSFNFSGKSALTSDIPRFQQGLYCMTRMICPILFRRVFLPWNPQSTGTKVRDDRWVVAYWNGIGKVYRPILHDLPWRKLS
jgi:hypothetical protein